MFHREATLETPRLILRPLQASDAPAVFVWAGDPEVNRYMSYTLYTRVEDVSDWIESLARRSGYDFGMVRREDGLLIGSCGIYYQMRTDTWDFGYNLRRDCWNQGYTTEAVRAMMAYVYKRHRAHHFSANHAAANGASGAVMMKCGLHFFHQGSYSKSDGSSSFLAHFYRLDLKPGEPLPWEAAEQKGGSML